jgi:hypothetical protein
MIEVHATQKLLKKLPVDENGYLPADNVRGFLAARDDGRPGLLSGWHANLLIVQRRQCVLFVHDQTRFPLFMPGLRKPDFANLDRRFADSLMNTLMKVGASEPQMDRAGELLQRLRFDTVCNRSVQGTMNRAGQEVKYVLDHTDTDVGEITGYRHSAWLANTPCHVRGRKDCIWPIDAFKTMLIATSGAGEAGVPPNNVTELDSWRR